MHAIQVPTRSGPEDVRRPFRGTSNLKKYKFPAFYTILGDKASKSLVFFQLSGNAEYNFLEKLSIFIDFTIFNEKHCVFPALERGGIMKLGKTYRFCEIFDFGKVFYTKNIAILWFLTFLKAYLGVSGSQMAVSALKRSASAMVG